MVHICLEALIRLLFEIVRVLFGDVTLIWRGGYLETEIPALLSTLKWILFFTLIAMVTKNRLLKNLIILGVPAVFSLLIDGLSLIPYIGTFFSISIGIVGVPISALAWAFVLWTDDQVHWLLRLFATPGIMICAAINAVQPISIGGDLGFAVAIAYMPELMAFLAVIFIGVVIILSPTFLCSALNWVLVKWETIRYAGWKVAILGCLVFIRNKVIKIKNKL